MRSGAIRARKALSWRGAIAQKSNHKLLTVTGIGYLVLLYWFVQPGEAQANGYGEGSVA